MKQELNQYKKEVDKYKIYNKEWILPKCDSWGKKFRFAEHTLGVEFIPGTDWIRGLHFPLSSKVIPLGLMLFAITSNPTMRYTLSLVENRLKVYEKSTANTCSDLKRQCFQDRWKWHKFVKNFYEKSVLWDLQVVNIVHLPTISIFNTSCFNDPLNNCYELYWLSQQKNPPKSGYQHNVVVLEKYFHAELQKQTNHFERTYCDIHFKR